MITHQMLNPDRAQQAQQENQAANAQQEQYYQQAINAQNYWQQMHSIGKQPKFIRVEGEELTWMISLFAGSSFNNIRTMCEIHNSKISCELSYEGGICVYIIFETIEDECEFIMKFSEEDKNV